MSTIEITKKILDEANALVSKIEPLKGEMRVAYACNDCSQVHVNQFIPFALGRGRTFNACYCVLTHNETGRTKVLECKP